MYTGRSWRSARGTSTTTIFFPPLYNLDIVFKHNLSADLPGGMEGVPEVVHDFLRILNALNEELSVLLANP
jgi:hypothetical protein